MNKEITKIEQRQLHDLARSINDRESSIQGMKDKAVNAANSTICQVLEQGQELKKAKELIPHGLWQDWLSVNCPLVSYRTAARYMAIAQKLPRVADFSQVDSLRSAMAICDIEGRGESGEQKKITEDQQAIYLISKMSVKIVDYLNTHPLERIIAKNPDAQAVIRKDAEAMVGKLGGRIDWEGVAS